MRVKKRILENSVEAELTRRVHAAGGLCEKVTVIGSRGFFDRLVVLPGGRVFFVECKRPRLGRVSVHQIRRHALYKKLGAAVAIVFSSEQIGQLLATLPKK